jgi:predicted metalloprotease
VVKIRRGAQTRDVEYRGSAGRGRMPIPMPSSRGGKAGAGVGGAGLLGLIAVVVISLLGGEGGGGLGDIIGQMTQGASTGGSTGPVAERDEFLEVVFVDVQNYWEATLPGYRRATMVIFNDSVTTGGCGNATSASGPFYCPPDEQVYLDADFFEVLAGPQFGAAGDFAQAYVVAHEVAHHVQTLTGVSGDVRSRQQSAGSQEEANALTIRLELQADCLAGSWASVAARRPQTFEGNNNLLYLESGDLSEGLRAAEAVGDDRIQAKAGQQVNPHNWTHGSAEQREAWFTLGLDTGDPTRCNDTFDESIDATRIMPS